MKTASKKIETSPLSSIGDILHDVRLGKPIILVDDEDRENEGDLIIAGAMASAENINFMAREGRGLICLPMEQAIGDRLGLELMGRGNNTNRTAFTVSIEAKKGITTGISAADRAKTILTAIDLNSGPNDLATPGHVFPLLAKEGGVLVRAGHTEAAVDLAKLAGFSGAGVICEIMNDDGTMARLPDLIKFAQKHDMKIGTIADLIAHRRRTENLVHKIHESVFTSSYGGEFRFFIYENSVQPAEHVALVKGDIRGAKKPVLVRMHAVDFVGDILGGAKDSTLHKSMQIIGEAGRGVIVILRDSDPKNLSNRIKSENKKSTNLKDYGIGAQILLDLGVRDMTLITNSPKNVIGLEGYGLYIAGHRTL